MESEENLKEGCFVGTRREMITPWSTNAVEITQNMGLEGAGRIESTSLLRTKCKLRPDAPTHVRDSTKTYSRQTVSRNQSSTLKISKCTTKKKVWLFPKKKWTT